MGIPPAPISQSLPLMGPFDHSPNRALWIKVLERRQQKKLRIKKSHDVLGCTKRPMILKKRRVLLEVSRRPRNGVERKIEALQRLVPNGEHMGLDGLFRETADYIMCLEMQVKVMKTMVEVLSGSDK